MSIPREVTQPLWTTRHAKIASAGTFFWASLHGSFATAPGYETVAESIVAGSAAAGKWSTDPLRYTFPTDNGGTNDVGLLVAHDVDDNLDAVFSLADLAIGEQLVIACECEWEDHSGTGYIWYYGANGAATAYGIALTAAQNLQIAFRGEGASSSETLIAGTAFTLNGATAISDAAWRDQQVTIVTSIYKTSSTQATIEFQISDGTRSLEGEFSNSIVGDSGTGPPGKLGSAAHPGLWIGCSGSGASVAQNFWGNGAANDTANVGNVLARKYASYDADRAADILAELLARPGDVPSSMLADAWL